MKTRKSVVKLSSRTKFVRTGDPPSVNDPCMAMATPAVWFMSPDVPMTEAVDVPAAPLAAENITFCTWPLLIEKLDGDACSEFGIPLIVTETTESKPPDGVMLTWTASEGPPGIRATAGGDKSIVKSGLGGGGGGF